MEGGTAQLLCEKLGKAIARENNYIIPPAESANGKNCQITKLPNRSTSQENRRLGALVAQSVWVDRV